MKESAYSFQGYQVSPMKIVDAVLPSDTDTIAISQLSAEYIQQLDCCQLENDHPDGCQILTITTEDGGGGKFYRIKTGEAGWSFSHTDDLVDVLTDFIKRLKYES